MRVRHITAAALAAILLIQSAGFAQSTADADIRTVSQQEAARILLANLPVGAGVVVELISGEHIEGRLVETSGQQFVVVDGQQRRSVDPGDVVSVRVPMKARMTAGKAFRLAAGISFGVVVGAYLAFAAGLR